MQSRSQRIENIFKNLRADTMHLLDSFYAQDVVFEDPLGSLNGLEDLRAYYMHLYSGATTVDFDFSDEICVENKHVVFWTMSFQSKRLNAGRTISVIGNSKIVFDDESNLVMYHRDFFDMGAMIYEHLPLIGWLNRKVKQKLTTH